MSTLTDALASFVEAVVDYNTAQDVDAAAQRLSRAGDAYETALAQFTADVARHAVT